MRHYNTIQYIAQADLFFYVSERGKRRRGGRLIVEEADEVHDLHERTEPREGEGL